MVYSFLLRTDNLALPTVNCLYHRYRRYRWIRFLKATSCPWNNANYLFHQTILHIRRWCIHFSIGTDGQPRFTVGKLPLPSVPSVPMDKFFRGLPHALGTTLTTCFTKRFYTFTDDVFIFPSVRTDNLALLTVIPLPSVPSVPMDKVFEGYLMPLKQR